MNEWNRSMIVQLISLFRSVQMILLNNNKQLNHIQYNLERTAEREYYDIDRLWFYSNNVIKITY